MSPAHQAIQHLGKFERLQLVEDIWDEFATDKVVENDPRVLSELERRASSRDTHPNQGKSLSQIAQSLGVRL